jgi:hypothetical protein
MQLADEPKTMMPAEPAVLSPVRVARLASAFELSRDEVLADVPLILGWFGSPAKLRAQLSASHGWRTNEAFHFIRWVQLGAWCSRYGVPD